MGFMTSTKQVQVKSNGMIILEIEPWEEVILLLLKS